MKPFNLKPLGETLAALRSARSGIAVGFVGRLAVLDDFGPNPGGLLARSFVPAGMQSGAPLVVVLHGCTQSAAQYDHGSGWSTLAKREGFALLFAEQTRSANPNLCFNWFKPSDVTRGKGEAASIHQMIEAMIERHGLDRARVFITGLSAGGAMAASMLAIYPEIFAAGAIVAGISHGVAQSMPGAFAVMHGKLPAESSLQMALSSASMHRGPWPRVAIWQGGADATVAPANAGGLLAQWRGAHGAATTADTDQTIGGARRRRWSGRQGDAVIEMWDIPGMGHGTPIAPNTDGLGHAMPFMLDVGVSSTSRIAQFFGLEGAERVQSVVEAAPAPKASTLRMSIPQTAPAKAEPATQLPHAGPVILAPGDEEASRPVQPESVGTYVSGVIDTSIPGHGHLASYIRGVIDGALKKAGLK